VEFFPFRVYEYLHSIRVIRTFLGFPGTKEVPVPVDMGVTTEEKESAAGEEGSEGVAFVAKM